MTLCTMSLSAQEVVITESRSRPAFRARCLRLAPQNPRWADLSGSASFESSDRSLPTALGPSATLTRLASRFALPPRKPSGARLARRDFAAWAAARALRTPVATTAPAARLSPAGPKSPTPHLRRRLSAVPALERPRARPRSGRGGVNMYLFLVHVKDYFQAQGMVRDAARRAAPHHEAVRGAALPAAPQRNAKRRRGAQRESFPSSGNG